MPQDRTVVLADLPQAEKERFVEFLIANRVKFNPDENGELYTTTLRIVPQQTDTSCIVYRAKNKGYRTPTQNARCPNQPRPKAHAAHSDKEPAGGALHTDLPTTLRMATEVLKRRYSSFCALLSPLVKAPKQLKRIPLMRFADDVYTARFEKDAQIITDKARHSESGGTALPDKQPQSFPEHVFEFCSKKYGLKALVASNCWGLVSSVEMSRGQHPGIDLFGKFLDESYDATDLLFFLFMRSNIERVMGSAQSARDDEDSSQASKAKLPGQGGTVPSQGR